MRATQRVRHTQIGHFCGVSGSRALALGGALLVVAAVALVLADALNAPALGLVACVGVAGAVGVREKWRYQGLGRRWLVPASIIGAAIVLGFVAAALTH